MILTGYHGTSTTNGHSIIASKTFKYSNGPKEWLGKGIYFYENITDAQQWVKDGQPSCVISAIIKSSKKYILDLDTDTGKSKFFEAIELFVKYNPNTPINKAQENQCAVCNLVHQLHPKYKLFMGSFAYNRTVLQTLTDARPKRREMAVKDHSIIKSFEIIKDKK